MSGTDLERALTIAQEIVDDPKRMPNSKRVILARNLLKVSERLFALMEAQETKEIQEDANVQ